MFGKRKLDLPLPTADQAPPGRTQSMPVAARHAVLPAAMEPDLADLEQAVFGLGCFWGAERKFWQADGVVTTSVGYGGGHTPNPSYEEVCSGATGHTELVRVVFDPNRTTYGAMLSLFWESHDPTQGMRQGNDMGTQYRSAIYTFGAEQQAQAERSCQAYQAALGEKGFGQITTEIAGAGPYYFAEDYHQQYLAKNPNGYCGLGGTGVGCPTGILSEPG